MAAPVLASVTTYNALNTPTSNGYTIGGSATAGDLVIIIHAARDSGTVTTPAGWNVIEDTYYATAVVHLTILWRIVQTGDDGTTHTVTNSGAKATAGVILRVEGVDTTTPINVSAGLSSTSNASQAYPTVTTTVADTLLIYSSALQNCTLTDTLDAALTFRSNPKANASTSGQQLYVSSETVSGAGSTSTRTDTWSSAAAFRKFTIAVAPAATTFRRRDALIVPGTAVHHASLR